MDLKGRNATWLELAVAPLWKNKPARVRIHPLKGGGSRCVGISVDERWLCSSDGRLTVFGGRESAARFLDLLHIDYLEDGDAVDLPENCGCGDEQCLCLSGAGLRPCGRAQRRPEQQPMRFHPALRSAAFSREAMR